jgi:hypothetical protein
MKRVIGLLGVIIIVSTCPALAQSEAKEADNGEVICPGVSPRMFDPKTVTTIRGQVECLAKFPQKRIGSDLELIYQGVVLQTDKGRFPVYLGPRWYLNKQQVKVKEGDKLEVIASRLSMGKNVLFVAREVKVNGNSLMLRDEQGKPLWRTAGPETAPGQ